MKKLLSMLATLGLTATAASTVVACGVKKNTPSPKDDVKADENGDVTVGFDITPDGEITGKEELEKMYGVVDENGNKISNAQIVSPDKFPIPAGRKIEVKIKYNVGNGNYDGKDHVNKIVRLNPTTLDPIKDSDVKTYTVKGTGHPSPDYVDVSSKVSMKKPELDDSYVTDDNGFYKGVDKTTGKTYPVNKDGYLVDNNKNDEGYSKRIAGLDASSNPIKDNAKDGDGKIIYLDDDGYRIKNYNADEAEKAGVTAGWHRVSNNGKNALGPDAPAKTAWELNNGHETEVDSNVSANAPIDPFKYVKRDASGKITAYMNDKGEIIDSEGSKESNANYGKPIKDSNDKTQVVDTLPPFAMDNGTDEQKSANRSYQKESVKKYTLKGTADIKLGSKGENGSIVIGEEGGLSKGTAKALNPADPDSHNWQTIPNGKYAGMKVRIDESGTKVEFEWPVSQKQTDDIISDSGKINKNPDPNSPVDADGKINLPIEYNDGKNGEGKKFKENKVTITTPWDSNSDGSGTDNKDESLRWWIDSTMTKPLLSYTDESTAAKVYLSKALVEKLYKNEKFDGLINSPVFDSGKLRVSIDGYKDDTKNAKEGLDSIIKKDESGINFIQLNIGVVPQFDFSENDSDLDIDFGSTDPKNQFISGAKAADGTAESIKVSTTAIDKKITFKEIKQSTDDENSVSFVVDGNKLPKDVNFDIDPIVLIKEKSSDGKFVNINQSGLLTEKDGFKYKTNGKDRVITLKFADGKLDKGNYELTTKFAIKDDRTADPGKGIKPFGPVENELEVIKDTATTEEKKIKFDTNDAKFNGKSVEWSVFAKGEFIDSKSIPSITIEYAQSAGIMLAENVAPDKIKWDGTKLSFDINEDPGNNPYNIKTVFDLKDNAGNSLGKTDEIVLSAAKDNGRDIAWANQDRSALTFGGKDSLSIDLTAKDSNLFDAQHIDEKQSSIKYVGPLDLKYNSNFVGSQAVITLDDEIDYQAQKLDFIISAVDDKGNWLNKETISIAKDQAMNKYSQIDWTTAEEEFDDTTVKFMVKDRNTLKDIDFDKLDKDNIALISNDTNQGDKYTLSKDKYDISWDGTELTITLKDEIKKGDYKFDTKFALRNGYQNAKFNSTSATLTVAKNVPLRKNTNVELQLEGDNNLDNGVTYKVIGEEPKGVNLKDTDAIKAVFSNSDYEGKVDFKYNESDKTMNLSLKPNEEIPGGQTDIKIMFALKDFDNNGYSPEDSTGKTILVTGYEGNITKKEPTKGFTDIKFKNTEEHIAADGNSVTFALDESIMSTKGVDVDTSKLNKIEQSTDGGKTWESLATDGTKAEYKGGNITISFADSVMNTTDLFKDPHRQFRVFFGIGNGYADSQFAKDNPDGIKFEGLTAIKDHATTFEKTVTSDNDAANPKDFYNPEDGADWTLETKSDVINWDIDSAKVDITWTTKSKYDIPLDPNEDPVYIHNDDEEAVPVIDKDKSPRKDPNKHKEITLSDAGNGKKKIHLALPNGSLWKDTYTVSIRFKLNTYKDEYSDAVELTFKKDKANEAETKIVPYDPSNPDNPSWPVYKMDEYNGGSGSNWKGKIFTMTITFKEFGGCIDPLNEPTLVIFGSGKKDAGDKGDKNAIWQEGSSKSWKFVKRSVDKESGRVSFQFTTTSFENVGSYFWGDHYTGFGISNYPVKVKYDAKIKVSFLVAGFGSSTYGTPVIFHADYYPKG